jgi:hypothetical protein
VRLPRVEEQLAAHGPAQHRGHEHRHAAEHRAAAAVCDHRDADDRSHVRQARPDREPVDRAEHMHRDREDVEPQRPGLLMFVPTL